MSTGRTRSPDPAGEHRVGDVTATILGEDVRRTRRRPRRSARWWPTARGRSGGRANRQAGPEKIDERGGRGGPGTASGETSAVNVRALAGRSDRAGGRRPVVPDQRPAGSTSPCASSAPRARRGARTHAKRPRDRPPSVPGIGRWRPQGVRPATNAEQTTSGPGDVPGQSTTTRGTGPPVLTGYRVTQRAAVLVTGSPRRGRRRQRRGHAGRGGRRGAGQRHRAACRLPAARADWPRPDRPPWEEATAQGAGVRRGSRGQGPSSS